jgi:hypothetical protein
MTKEIEMTKAEYKEFLKMIKSEQDRKYDFAENVLTNTTSMTTIVSIYSEVILIKQGVRLGNAHFKTTNYEN